MRICHADHHNDVIMGAMVFKITSLTIVYLTVCSGADQRKHQSSVSLAFVRGIHREFPAQRASNAEKVSIWWRHHVMWTAQGWQLPFDETAMLGTFRKTLLLIDWKLRICRMSITVNIAPDRQMYTINEFGMCWIYHFRLKATGYSRADELSKNSSRPSDVNMCQWIKPSLIQIIVCRLFGSNLFSEPILS